MAHLGPWHWHMATTRIGFAALLLLAWSIDATAQKRTERKPARRRQAAAVISYPPQLPGGKTILSVRTEQFLQPPPGSGLADGIAIARQAPTVDFLYYPHQSYPGKPWSVWGDGCAVAGKYYSAIGDHLAIGVKGDDPQRTGTAFVFEYDTQQKSLRRLVDVAELLDLPTGHYTPGKIHSRIELGSDGWLYFATHRGSARAVIDKNHYRGDWILRCHPVTGTAEIVAHAPVPKHSIPASVLDPERLVFYGSTAAGPDAAQQGIRFFAFDLEKRKLLFSGTDGPARSMIFAASTGCVYYVAGRDEGPLMRFDPSTAAAPVQVADKIGVRAATKETDQGVIYTVSLGQGQRTANLWSLNTVTSKVTNLGPAAVGTQSYVATLDVDPTGRYLYYVPGAHGGSDQDGSPLVQFDVRTRQKKIIAFLHPYFHNEIGCALKGTYSAAVDPEGDRVYITWNASRGSRAWDCCVLTVVHFPPAER